MAAHLQPTVLAVISLSAVGSLTLYVFSSCAKPQWRSVAGWTLDLALSHPGGCVNIPPSTAPRAPRWRPETY